MTKTTKEEIIRKKELVRYYQSQIYKLSVKVKFAHKQLEQLVKQIKDYEKEKAKLEK
jgi:hypothetical protein